MRRSPTNTERRDDKRIAARTAVRSGPRRPRLDPDTEASILDIAFRFPARGQDRVAADLSRSKINVSASGVRYVWQRHNLETLDKRIAWIESRLSAREDRWSDDQLAARASVVATRRANALRSGVGGTHGQEVPRSQYILAVSARLIRERGFESTSLRDIALRAHIPVGSIYYHFPTKDELFEAVYAQGIRHLEAAIERAVSGVDDPWRRLELACEVHLAYLCGGDDFTAIAIPTRLPPLSPTVRERVVRLSDTYEALFRALVDALETRAGIQKGVLRLQLLGALNWTSVWYRPGDLSLSEIARQLVRTLRKGVAIDGPVREGEHSARKSVRRNR